jgi:acetolactate synthase-1/2/3 large subunit
MLTDITDAADANPWQALKTHPADEDIDNTIEILSQAKSPIIIVGGSGWSEATRLGLQSFAEESSIPVVNTFRCQDYIDHQHPTYIGDLGIGVNPALSQRIQKADTLLVIGRCPSWRNDHCWI